MRNHLLVIPVIAMAAACGTATAAPDTPAGNENPTPTVQQQVEGRVVSLDADRIVVDLLEVRSDPDAPNDVVVDDPDSDTVVWTLDDDLAVTMLDCRMACEPAEVPAADWVDGTAIPYGGADAVYRFVVVDDAVREVLEVYLP